MPDAMMPPSHPNASAPLHSRSGSVLLLVLGTMVLLLSMVLFSAGIVRSRARLTHDALARESARDTLILAISNAVDLLRADTNGVDHLHEPWALDDTHFPPQSPFHGHLSDASGFLPLATATPELLAAALATAPTQLSTPQLAQFASNLALWRDTWIDQHEGTPPPAFAFYAQAGAAQPTLIAHLQRCGSVYSTGPINVNTAPADVLQAVLVASGATPFTAREMTAHALATRSTQNFLTTVSRATLSALFLGEGALATSQEANVLSRAERLLQAQSPLFNGFFLSSSPRIEISFVYNRDENLFLLWDEGP